MGSFQKSRGESGQRTGREGRVLQSFKPDGAGGASSHADASHEYDSAVVVVILAPDEGIPRSLLKIEFGIPGGMQFAALGVEQARRSDSKSAAKRFQEMRRTFARVGGQQMLRHFIELLRLLMLGVR